MTSLLNLRRQFRLLVVADLSPRRNLHAQLHATVRRHRPGVICILGEVMNTCTEDLAVLEVAHRLASLPVTYGLPS